MSFLALLQNLGDRLGILETAERTAAQPASKIKTRSVTLAELATEIRSEEVRALAELPAELTVTFEKIFETAGINSPAHGWTVDRLRKLLETESLREKPREMIQKEVVGILTSEGVPAEDIVREAIARDKALDSFEAFARRKLDNRMVARERRLAEIRSQLDSLMAESSKLEQNQKADEEKWREWRKQKCAQERDLAYTVGFLIDRTVITTEDED